MAPQILYNALETPDGTLLHSRSVHDYQDHRDALTGKHYMIDGGTSYVRCSANGDELMLTKYLTEDHEHNRQWFHWGTRGPDNRQPLRFVPLREITDEHLLAIAKTQKQLKGTYIEDLFLHELMHRDLLPWEAFVGARQTEAQAH